MFRASLTAAFAALTLFAAGCGSPTVTATDPPAPTTTTASSAPPTPITSTSTPAPTFDLKPTDFKVDVKVTKQTCFGSAGCNVSFHIEPQFVGQSFLLPKTGTTYVTYQIKGAEQPMINTFTVTGTTMHYDGEETTQTAKASDTLTAEVTSLEYRP